jgi:hypothetical protein
VPPQDGPRGLNHVGAKNTKTESTDYLVLLIKTSAFSWNNNCLTKLHINIFNRSRVVPLGQTDTQTVTTRSNSCLLQFCECDERECSTLRFMVVM